MVPHKNSDNEPYWAGHMVRLKRVGGLWRIRLQRLAVVLIKWDVDVELYVVYTMWENYEEARHGKWRIKEVERSKFFDVVEEAAQKVVRRFSNYKSITSDMYLKQMDDLGFVPVFPSTIQMYINDSVEFGHEGDFIFEVECTDNKDGFKDYFDIGQEYRAKEYRGIFKVEDKFGDFRTCSRRDFRQ